MNKLIATIAAIISSTMVIGCSRPTEGELQTQKQQKQLQIEEQAKAMADAAALRFKRNADSLRDQGEHAFKAGQYASAYHNWLPGAFTGDSEQQELIADLLLGPHAHAVKRNRYEGTHFLYLAAVGGRRTAMLKLSKALSKGELGFRKSPEAATCWSKMPADFGQRLNCVAVTDFQDHRARPSCFRLIFPSGEKRINGQNGITEQDGVTSAKLCLANKTPALFQPGIPARGEELEHEYEKHGIDWSYTGDVYDGDFENFRKGFNVTIAEAIEAERGPGYLERIYKEIRAKIAKKPQ